MKAHLSIKVSMNILKTGGFLKFQYKSMFLSGDSATTCITALSEIGLFEVEVIPNVWIYSKSCSRLLAHLSRRLMASL